MSGSETPGFSYSKSKKRRQSHGGGSSKTPQSASKKRLQFPDPPEPRRPLPMKEIAALKKGIEPPPTPGFHFQKAVKRDASQTSKASSKKAKSDNAQNTSMSPPTSPRSHKKKASKEKDSKQSSDDVESPRKADRKGKSSTAAAEPSSPKSKSPKRVDLRVDHRKRKPGEVTQYRSLEEAVARSSPAKAAELKTVIGESPKAAKSSAAASPKKSASSPKKMPASPSANVYTAREPRAMKDQYSSMKQLVSDAITVELNALPAGDPYAVHMAAAGEAFLHALDSEPALLRAMTADEVAKARQAGQKASAQQLLPNPQNAVLKQKEELYARRLRELKVEEEQWEKTKQHYKSMLKTPTQRHKSPVKLSKEEMALIESPRKAAAAVNASELFQGLALNVDDANRTARELDHLRSTADEFFTRLATQVHKQRTKSANPLALVLGVAKAATTKSVGSPKTKSPRK